MAFIGRRERHKEVRLPKNGLVVVRSLSFKGWQGSITQTVSLVPTVIPD